METSRVRLSTTYVDLHGERMTVGALRGMAEAINARYLTVLWNHDVRFPPIGRAYAADVVPLADGEFALDAKQELWGWAARDDVPLGSGGAIEIAAEELPTFGVVADRTFRSVDDLRFLRELASLAGPSVAPREFAKKAVEPLSVLTITAGVFVLESMSRGFLQRLGADLYDRLKDHLKSRYVRPLPRPELLDFQFGVLDGQHALEVHVLDQNATADSVDALFRTGFDQIDALVAELHPAEAHIAKVFLDWRNGSMHLRYAVRIDGIPVHVSGRALREFRRVLDQTLPDRPTKN